MLKKSMLFAVVFTLSSLALAQQKTQQHTRADGFRVVGNSTTTCNVTFSSGSGANATTFCVTANGNIAQFSVGGQEMIAVGDIEEGYGICDKTSGIGYYDYAEFDSGNWGPPTFSRLGNVVTIVRLTADGNWQLTQTITNMPGSATAPGSAKVAMAVKNLSSIARTVLVVRFADVDADSDFINDFDYTPETAYGLEPGFRRGLGSTNNTFNGSIEQLAFAQNVSDGPDPCIPATFIAGQPFVGDGSIEQAYAFTVGHNGAKTVVSTYKPI